MSDINFVVLSGTLADAPRQIATQKGSMGVSFRLKTVREYGGKEYSAHISVKHFGDAAQAVLASAQGTPLVVSGRLELDSWEDKAGQKHYETVVKADTVAGYNPPPQAQQQPPQQQYNPPATNAYGQVSPYQSQAQADEPPF